MKLKNFIHITRCWTGRIWINLFSGMFAIGISTTPRYRTRIELFRGKIRRQF